MKCVRQLTCNDPEFVRSVSCVDESYYVFLANDVQLNDIADFCCTNNNILCIDTTYNLCNNWVTDCCYTNKRIETKDGKNPTFLGPSILHFNKEEFIFGRFISEMCTYNPQIRGLRIIGTDLDKAIFNGFSSQIPDLRLLLCFFTYLLSDLHPPKGSQSINTILGDIYGLRYGPNKELGLADAKDSNDLNERLDRVRESWENICPGFFDWFVKRRKPTFERSVIESARQNSDVQGLFYNNGVENKHFQEKKEQSFEKGSILEVTKTIKTLVERQQHDEIRALYGSGPYRLCKEYQRFEIDPVKWHSYEPERRKTYVEKFRNYQPGLEDTFKKPKNNGRKSNERKRNRKLDVENIFDPLEIDEEEEDPVKKKPSDGIKQSAEKSINLEDPHKVLEPKYELHLRSKVSRLVVKCQGNCGKKIKTADKEDFFLVKSSGRSYFTVHGRSTSRVCPQYIHFQNDCLKQFSREKFQVEYDNFPFDSIIIAKETYAELSDETIAYLMSYGVTIQK